MQTIDGRSAKAAPLVTDVSVSDWLPAYQGDEEYGVLYVYPESNTLTLDELRLHRGVDLDQWFDDTGYRWPSDTRDKLRGLIPDDEPEPLPQIQTLNVGLDEQRDLAIPALLAMNHPPILFRRGALVTEVAADEAGVPFARMVTPPLMRERLSDAAVWVGKSGRVKAPADLAGLLLETQRLHLPALVSIVEHPVMGPAGTVTTHRGYDRETGTYFAPSMPMRRIRLTDEDGGPPEQVDCRIALSWLAELMEDFEFVSKADKANVLGLMLTPILRPIINGPVPLAAVRAVRAGTGKSLLVKAALSVLTGRSPSPTSLGTDEDEAEKRITTEMLKGTQIIYLDNIKTGRVLESSALAMALTSDTWTGRIIRYSKAPPMPIRCTWVATGNNLTMNDELARRAYLIELTSEIERPDLRDASAFHHPDLIGWVRENRAELLTSLLVLARAWSYETGMELTEGPVLASFEEWSSVVGSVLRFAGVRDFLGNEEHKRDLIEDETNLERANLLIRIREHMGDNVTFTIKAFHATTWTNEDVALAAIPFLDGVPWDKPEAVRKLGYAVRAFKGASFGGLKLLKVAEGREGVKFRVVAG